MDRTDENLIAALAHTTGEVGRTDTKAGHLLALDGLLVAALSLLGKEVHGLALGLSIASAVALIGAVVLAVLVIRPRLKGRGTTDRGSFLYWANAPIDEITRELQEDRRAIRVQVLSRIALRKMRVLQLAGDASLTALILLSAAILFR